MPTQTRASGVLLHISSLPGDYSIGAFGEEARKFVDFLAKSGFTYWQTLPLCMTDGYNSPYSSPGTFSINPYFIDLPSLRDRGLISDGELSSARQKTPYSCEFERLGRERISLLLRAASRCNDAENEAVQRFIAEHGHIGAFCEFISAGRAEPLSEWQFIEYTAYTQWLAVKKYANTKGIKIIGDLPIYVDLHSSDVAANPDLFELDEAGHPARVAGVPPDYFSADGQKWGNPLYNWADKSDALGVWWNDRITAALTLFDGVRIDHFRGLSSYYAIPADAKTAQNGAWERGPGLPFVNMLKKTAEKLGGFIIAEDLGELDADAAKLVADSGLPGMRVLQFAFLSSNNVHMPHNYVQNCICYTGTHDNNTLLGYLWESVPGTRAYTLEYCGFVSRTKDDWQQGCEPIIREGMKSVADTFILPIQDILGYGGDTRMNRPGRADGNWAYRTTAEQIAGIDTEKLLRMNRLYGRAAK
jgi:4-alpha-glucanotransferase